MEKPEVDIIMLSHNQTDLTVKCIETLGMATEDTRFRLIWIDNGSEHAHRLAVLDKLNELQINFICHMNDDNWGFPKAVNLGLALSTAPYMVLLNDDVEFRQVYLNPVKPLPTIKGYEAMPTAPPVPRQNPAVFARMVEHIERTGAHLAATLSTSGWQNRTSLAVESLARDAEDGAVVLPRDHHPAFFCTMLTRHAIQHVGYLSEAMGEGFGEDDDYNERMEDLALKRLLCLDCHVIHHHRSTWKALKTTTEIAASQAESMKVLQNKYGRQVW